MPARTIALEWAVVKGWERRVCMEDMLELRPEVHIGKTERVRCGDALGMRSDPLGDEDVGVDRHGAVAVGGAQRAGHPREHRARAAPRQARPSWHGSEHGCSMANYGRALAGASG
jgi:hypothetical protein